MSKAHWIRFAIHIGALLVAGLVWLQLVEASYLLAALAAASIFFAIGALGESQFRRRATREEIRADLEDRVRNSC